MEGFLQSLKFDKEHIQVEVCKLVGRAAKKRGRSKDWRVKQVLYWKGVTYDRHGKEYQELLDRAYRALCEQSESFRKALLATQSATLTHSIGKTNTSETILTRREYCSRLTKLRKELQDKTGLIEF